MSRLVVVGGGITGLVAAFRASQQPGLEVTLLEARDSVGGKINTIGLAGARIELGADSFLPRDEGPLRLCRDIGVSDELIEPADFGGWVYRDGALRRLPGGTVLGFPASLRTLVTTGVLSPAGKARAAADLFSPRRLAGPDISVAAFTRRRMGAEVLERLVDPLLAGTRAGSVDEMSLAAAIPPVDAAARSHRSAILGLRRQRIESGGRPRFFAPRSGMHRLIEALENESPKVEIRRSSAVRSIRTRTGGFALSLDEGEVDAEAVIIATPSHVAADIVRDLSPEAAAELAQIGHSSSAVINLLFPPDSIGLPSGGSGVLFPSSENMTLSGCTWFSSKWPALAAEEGLITIRCFVGRAERDPALDLDDRDLVGVVTDELGRIIDVGATPVASHTTRWDRGMPRYAVGHLEGVARIERLLLATGPLALAGASYRGSGIPDCIGQAERAVGTMVDAFRG